MNGEGAYPAGGPMVDCPPEDAVVVPGGTGEKVEGAKPPFDKLRAQGQAAGAKPVQTLPAPTLAP
jgi:hypothetical protein